MFRKIYFTFLLTVVLFLIGNISVFAQTAPIAGRVELKGADGTMTPVAGALVEVFRTNIKGNYLNTKTDKKGNFSFAGLPLGTIFFLSISGEGIGPEIIPNIKPGGPGMDKLMINVLPGDGKRWTEDEIRDALANPNGSNKTPEESPEDKKRREDFEKQKVEAESKNKKIDATNKIINTALQEGGKAYEAKNYDLAIAKFDEGYNADPTFAGTAPVLLNNKALALINRGTDTYNKSVKTEDAAARSAARESAKNDFLEAAGSSDKALEILKTATSSDPNVQKNYETNKFSALTNRKNAYRLMAQTGVEREKGQEALAAFQEYMAAETDPAKKSKAQLDLALTLQDSNEFEEAVEEFQKILDTDPNNVDALVGIGLSLVNIGYINLDTDPAKGKQQLQEAANFLQKFVDLAPDTHKFKKDAVDTIAQLKDTQKVTPQKVTKSTTTKKKN